MMEPSSLHCAAREIFNEALKSVDAKTAVRRAVRLEDSQLKIVNTIFNLRERSPQIYAVAIGKAARPMAEALAEILGERLTAGIIAAPAERSETSIAGEQAIVSPSEVSFSDRWRLFTGGHPLPNLESLNAGRAAFELLSRAELERALIIFLISGGGSATIECPRDELTTLEELQAANRMLISCGARVAEINAVRSAISAIKGGGLARSAPRCDQVSLIISDTNAGEEATVASGPTFDSQRCAEQQQEDPTAIISRYKLGTSLPQSILRAIEQSGPRKTLAEHSALRAHYVLLDNAEALAAAATAARARGLAVEFARDIVEQPVAEGCTRLLSRLLDLHGHRAAGESGVCLISGGEFSCPVHAEGIGGRNAESALRWAIELDAFAGNRSIPSRVVALSAGTDGIDGNSPAAGAITYETTLKRARSMNLDARRFLDLSDAYTFFHALGDAIVTGPTGTNVRDLRIMIAG